MERHDLLHEFPEYHDKIHQLKTDDNHFKKLFDEYNELEHQVHRINTDVEVVTDEHAHEIKAKLLLIKDELYSMLTN
ncbi:YdcH family protein [Flavobacterium frigoris]|uniref:GTP-binding protein n=1 Tax=Flavobacterium frigoris TaxID=229204 RepID=A0A1H9IV56_FLAFI|nr:DUF465 domain-containing protein [Flavobacterium frigoris]SEQ78419.1 hypothetical protein SAMN05444355_104122 [Flavobacterium frigoris]